MGWGIELGRGWLSGRYAFSGALDVERGRPRFKEWDLTDWTNRFSAGRPRPQTPLDSIKFVCKDLWPLLFRKQIDNLKTNHRGVFVLTDQRFQPISRVSVDRKAGVKAGEETLSRAQAVSLDWWDKWRRAADGVR